MLPKFRIRTRPRIVTTDSTTASIAILGAASGQRFPGVGERFLNSSSSFGMRGGHRKRKALALLTQFLRRQILVNASRSFAAVAHSAHDQVGTAHEIASSEDTRHAGHLVGVDNHPTPSVDLDVVRIASRKNRHRIEAKCNQDDVDRHVEFGARNLRGLRRPLASGSPNSIRRQRAAATGPRSLPNNAIGLVRNMKRAPSSTAFRYSRRLPGMFSRSRR